MEIKRWWWVAAAVLAFATYAPTISQGTIIDDPDLLHADISVRALLFDPGPPDTLPYYRPITVSTYVALHAFGQGRTQVYAAHLSSVLLYAAAAATVYLLTLAMLRDMRHATAGAVGGTLLFIVHPVHTESVAWITARPDILVGLFIIAALFSYQRFRQTRSRAWLAATALAALAAPLSKEVGVAVFALLPAFEWLRVSRLEHLRGTATAQRPQAARRASRERHEPQRDARLVAAVTLVGVGIAYLAMRLVVFHSLGSSGLDFGELRPTHVFGALGFYAEKMFAPRDLVAYYAVVPSGARAVTIGILATVAFVGALAAALRTRAYAPAFGLIWIAATLLPSMPPFVAGPSNAPMAERYLYLPSIGLTICVAWLAAQGLAWIDERRTQNLMWRGFTAGSVALAAPLLVVAGVFAFATVTRLEAYSDLESFWATAARDNPSAGFARAGLAAEYARQGRLGEAEEGFRTAATTGVFEDDSWRGLAWDSLASIYLEQGDYTAAVDAYERGLALYPTSGKIHFNLALAHYRQANTTDPPDDELLQKALEEARLAVENEPDSQLDLILLASVAEANGEFTEASDAYRAILRIDGGSSTAARARQELTRLEAMGR